MPQISQREWNQEKAEELGWEDGFNGLEIFSSIPDEFKNLSGGLTFPFQSEYKEEFERGCIARRKNRIAEKQ